MTGCIGEVDKVTLSPTISPAPTAADESQYPNESSGSNTGAIVGAVVGGIAGFCALICLLAFCRNKRDEREPVVTAEGGDAEETEGSDYVALSQDETPSDPQEGGASDEQGELT
mmetsp:Transcript_19824/g.27197  ORF Transcript_19824/g.27197 Transcript_19824/m.27197 type:complete len:114 (-) Transcript_19824:167-508(-)